MKNQTEQQEILSTQANLLLRRFKAKYSLYHYDKRLFSIHDRLVDRMIRRYHGGFNTVKNVVLEDYCDSYLPKTVSDNFKSLDGSDIAIWLAKNGIEISNFFDAGMNGLVITKSGYRVSTSGYVSKNEDY